MYEKIINPVTNEEIPYMSPYYIETRAQMMSLDRYLRSPKKRRHLKKFLRNTCIFFVREMNKEEPDFMLKRKLSSIVLVPCVTKEWMTHYLVDEFIESEEDYIRIFKRLEESPSDQYDFFMEKINKILDKVINGEYNEFY